MNKKLVKKLIKAGIIIIIFIIFAIKPKETIDFFWGLIEKFIMLYMKILVFIAGNVEK